MKRIAYWFDLHGPDGTPANGKVLGFCGFCLGWAVVITWLVGALITGGELGSDFVFAFGMVLGSGFGIDGFKTAVKAKHGTSGGTSFRGRKPIARDGEGGC